MPGDERRHFTYWDRKRFEQRLEGRRKQQLEDQSLRLEELAQLVGRKVEKDGVVYRVLEVFPLPEQRSELLDSAGEPSVVLVDDQDQHFWGPIPLEATAADVISTLEGNGYTFIDVDSAVE